MVTVLPDRNQNIAFGLLSALVFPFIAFAITGTPSNELLLTVISIRGFSAGFIGFLFGYLLSEETGLGNLIPI